MKTTLTVKKIADAQPALVRLASEKFKGANAGKIIYNISRNIGFTEPIVIAYQKAYNALVKNFRVKRKARTEQEEDAWIIPDESQQAFQDAIEAEQNREEEIEVRQVVLPATTDDNPSHINGIDRYLLDWMVKVEGEE